MSEVVTPLIYQFGIGGIGGFIVGFAVKKIGKIVAVILGLILILLIYLSTQAIISINYSALFDWLAGSLGLVGSAFSWVAGIISLLPFAGSFVAGFLLGFKIG
jgi:uncharacterized membrane protein (Fun14 family)